MLALVLAQGKWLVAFAAIVGVAIFSYRGLVPGGSYDIYVPMPDAAGLYPGSDVLVAGSKAGTVEDLQLKAGRVLVHIALDPAHSPIRTDSTVVLRPKSLLGEKYLDLRPGRSGLELSSGGSIPAQRVDVSTDLDQVISTFDAPTREKLKTIIDELGGGLAGRGTDTNATIRYGTTDMNDLADIADTLKTRDQELEKIIAALDDVLSELAQSDRRQQLGELIANTNKLIGALADQDAELKRALSETNAALSKTDNALEGTQGNLVDIVHEVPVLVDRTNSFMGHLSTASDAVLGVMPTSLEGIRNTPIVFGGHDANGYATRISVLVGASSGGPTGSSITPGAAGNSLAAAGNQDADLYSFLLGEAGTGAQG